MFSPSLGRRRNQRTRPPPSARAPAANPVRGCRTWAPMSRRRDPPKRASATDRHGDRVLPRSAQSPRTTMTDFASVTQQAADVGSPPSAGPNEQRHLKLYKARWTMLAVYMVYSMANAVHWIQYSIISNITVKFYDVSSFAVDTTSTIYMIVYVPLVIPASWVLDRLVSSSGIISFALGRILEICLPGATKKCLST